MTLGHHRVGAGEPLVLIHGLGASRHVWRPVTDLLISARREVIAIDLPGFGDTPVLNHGTTPSPPELARAVAAGLAQLGLERPDVAGNSLGGWVALELALLGAARSVTAIAPAGLWSRALGPKPNVARAIGRTALPVIPHLMKSAAGRRLALAGTVARPERVPPDEAAALIEAYVSAPGFAEVNSAMRSSRFERLDEIDVPLTFGWPTRDRLVAKPRHLPSGSRSVDLKGCGHMPMWDDPGQVAELLLAGAQSP